MTTTPPPPPTLLIVLPSWVGDAVMATPAIARIQRAWSSTLIGLLCRPGIDQLFAGASEFLEIHTFNPRGPTAPLRASAAIRSSRYQSALLLPNSFSSALITRLAGIPHRTGYDRDHRGLLLTDPLDPPRNPDGSWTITPAAVYYWNLAGHLIGEPHFDGRMPPPEPPTTLPPDTFMSLPVSDADTNAADELLARAGLAPDQPFTILNPGGNNPAKRWPADRYAQLARHLVTTHNLPVLINGAPAESDLCEAIVSQVAPNASEGMDTQQGAPNANRGGEGMVFSLPHLNITLGALKSLCERARLMVTNDTGPRHIAAAMGAPLVTLFGPTDPRWTTIPLRTHADGAPRETILVADPTLPPDQSANDHPDRCRVDRITVESVISAADEQLRSAKI